MGKEEIATVLKSGCIALEDIMSQCGVSAEEVKEVAEDLGTRVYPKSVLTKDRKGNWEVRSLLRRGVFVEYEYLNPQTLEVLEKKKTKIYLKDEKEALEQWFIIPMSGPGKFLLIKQKDQEDKGIRIWVRDRSEPLWR